MPKVDFVISNTSHHVAMMQPVVRTMAEQEACCCRVISLCELRGLRTPIEQFGFEGVEVMQLVPGVRRSNTMGPQSRREAVQGLREAARQVSWRLFLRPRVKRWLDNGADLVVLPNDAAFPYDGIAQELREHSIPFLLMQEGVRFPLPARRPQHMYGGGGAAAIAAWGESSAAYFRSAGAPTQRIHLTGTPRLDAVAQTDWASKAAQLQVELQLKGNTLLFLSNPIDDQGYCTTQAKNALIADFIRELAPLFDDPAFRLVIKLHGREAMPDLQGLVSGLPFCNRVILLKDVSLYALFKLAQAAIVMASTVGLEALLFGLPLGVLELPGAGFVHDYVSSGAARGLSWSQPMAEQVKSLLEMKRMPPPAESYVVRNLAVRADATGETVKLITGLLKEVKHNGI